MSKVTGKVSQIVGPVIDVEFGSGADLPKIYDSLEINKPNLTFLTKNFILFGLSIGFEIR